MGAFGGVNRACIISLVPQYLVRLALQVPGMLQDARLVRLDRVGQRASFGMAAERSAATWLKDSLFWGWVDQHVAIKMATERSRPAKGRAWALAAIAALPPTHRIREMSCR